MKFEPVLAVENLAVSFSVPVGGLSFRSAKLQAIRDVSFELAPGEILGVVGESGCGKSTLARAILGLLPASSGKISWYGSDLGGLTRSDLRRLRSRVQVIFQDPLGSLDPRMTVGDAIAEPLRVHEPELPNAEVRRRVAQAMDRVGLSGGLLNRYPHEFSGGQCQRVGIARAMIVQPDVVICDEPVSALDVSIQAQIIALLKDLQQEFGLSLVFISHDLAAVRRLSDRVLVLYLGRVMELGPADAICENPCHPYSQALLSAVPRLDPDDSGRASRIRLTGELPSPLSPPAGCVFNSRCPWARDECRESTVLEACGSGHTIACHRWRELKESALRDPD
jgi:oligopeptide transport system ATP-binding protein